jgi:DNA anti-recombination protein RmuC
MSEQNDNLVIALLRKIDAKVDQLGADVREIKNRLGILESQYASISSRHDRLDERVERIERRLSLSDA